MNALDPNRLTQRVALDRPANLLDRPGLARLFPNRLVLS